MCRKSHSEDCTIGRKSWTSPWRLPVPWAHPVTSRNTVAAHTTMTVVLASSWLAITNHTRHRTIPARNHPSAMSAVPSLSNPRHTSSQNHTKCPRYSGSDSLHRHPMCTWPCHRCGFPAHLHLPDCPPGSASVWASAHEAPKPRPAIPSTEESAPGRFTEAPPHLQDFPAAPPSTLSAGLFWTTLCKWHLLSITSIPL